MENLATGTVHVLNDNLVSIGRSTGNFKYKIGLRPGTISRKHLLIFKDESAHDIRSRNGTSVNAVFLRYGNIRKLRQKDLVTLAGLAPFRYRIIEYAPLHEMGTADDIPRMAMMLASDDGRHITGQDINLTAGIVTY